MMISQACSFAGQKLALRTSHIHVLARISQRQMAPNINYHQQKVSTYTFLQFANICTRKPRSVLVCSSRLISRHSKRKSMPWEVDSNVLKDTTIFTYNQDRYFKMISIFGVVQFFFWGNLALFAYSSLDVLTSKEAKEKMGTGFMGGMLSGMGENRKKVAFSCMSIGYLVLFFTWIYPQRTVSQLMLLRGGQSLRFTTYTHFGRKTSFTAPIESVNFLQGREASQHQMSVKVKSKWFYYLMDKRTGKFHDTQLFDYAVGLKRNIKNK